MAVSISSLVNVGPRDMGEQISIQGNAESTGDMLRHIVDMYF